MKNRRIFLTLSVFTSLVFAAALGASACSAPDPGQVTPKDRARPGGGSTVDGGGGGGGGGAEDGGDGDDDGGGGDQAAAFFGDPMAPTFNAGGAPLRTSPTTGTQHTSTATVNCMNCHAGGDNPWSSAGIVFATRATPGTLQAGVQVLIRKPDGTYLETYTDARGRFAFPAAMDVPSGSQAGIRTGDTQRLMPMTINDGNCMNAGCHLNGEGSQGQIYLNP